MASIAGVPTFDTAEAINSSDQTTSVDNVDTTANTGNDTGNTSVTQVLDDLIGAAPGLILLARSPSNSLPRVTQTSTPSGKIATSVSAPAQPTNWMLVLFVVAITAILIAIITRK